MPSETPSTARTTGGVPSRSVRIHAAEPRKGKWTFRSSTSHRRGTAVLHREAGHEVFGRDLRHCRLGPPAALLDPPPPAARAAARGHPPPPPPPAPHPPPHSPPARSR